MSDKGVFWEGISEGMAQKLEKLVEKIPLLGSYLHRENARERDKIVREHIAQLIDHLKGAVMKEMEVMTDKRVLTGLDKLDRLCRRLDKLRDTIKFASHGYSGVFERVRILDTELERLMDYDLHDPLEGRGYGQTGLDVSQPTRQDRIRKLRPSCPLPMIWNESIEERMYAVTKGTQETPPPDGG